MNSHRPYFLRYLPWLLAPAAALVGLVLVGPATPPPDAPAADDSILPSELAGLKDGKVRRTAEEHNVPAAPADAGPLAAVNREGLRVDLRMPPADWEQLLSTGDRKDDKESGKPVTVAFAARPAVPGTVSLRSNGGRAAMGRPAFHLTLAQPEQFRTGISLRHLYLVDARADRHQIRTRFAYGLLADLGAFPLYEQYVDVSVNGRAVGVYLLVEPPVRGVRRLRPDAVAVYQRTGDSRYALEWDKATSAQGVAVDRLGGLGTAADGPPPAEAAAKLSALIDVDVLMNWLAVNAVLCNTATTDGLYLYELRFDAAQPGTFGLVGWGYEHTFVDQVRAGSFPDPLLYAGGGALERTVRGDPALYRRFQRRLAQLLATDLSPTALNTRIDQTRALRDAVGDRAAGGDREAEARLRAQEAVRMKRFVRDRCAVLTQRLAEVGVAVSVPTPPAATPPAATSPAAPARP